MLALVARNPEGMTISDLVFVSDGTPHWDMVRTLFLVCSVCAKNVHACFPCVPDTR